MFNKQKLTEEEAQKILMEANQKKIDACAKEINAILEKHGFEMRFNTQIILVPRQK